MKIGLQMVEFLSEDPCFVEFLEWIENEWQSEFLAVQEKGISHMEKKRSMM